MANVKLGYRKPKTPIIIPPDAALRAATRYKEEPDGCWVTTYAILSEGYARVGWGQSNKTYSVNVHRAAWVYHNGRQITDGYTIDHMCRNRACVNPTHLRELPNFENARRTSGRDWELGTCINGHSNDDLIHTPSGKRVCKLCRRAWERRHVTREPAWADPSKLKSEPGAPRYSTIEEAAGLLERAKSFLPPMSQRQLSAELDLMRPTIRKIEKQSSRRVDRSVTQKLHAFIEYQ